ncbi:MAG: hypothetical protein FWG93_08035, partial [Oscillospiraceae bacterium]|nr:hypothetical protein [Oscillospiraceae bacterium]
MLDRAAGRFGFALETREYAIGGCAID